jgi:uncharacterized protein (TIGR03437 family)
MRLLNLTVLVLGCAATSAAAPVIFGITNAAGWLPPGLVNSGIAQGSMFIVSGTGLGPDTLTSAPNKFPLPTTEGLAGTTIKVTVGGVAETCIMLYSYAGQVAAILPSATPTGTGTLTLTYQAAAADFSIQVVAATFDTFALNSDGTGTGVVTDLNYNVITYINAAHPGQTLVLWGSGLGAVTGDEAGAPPVQVDLDKGQVQVLVGNQLVAPIYAGRSNSPAIDQIDFTVPVGVTPACKSTLAVVVKGITGSVTSMPIAPEGQTTCGDTFDTLTAANLQNAISAGSLSLGAVALTRYAGMGDVLTGTFGTFTLDELIRSWAGVQAPSVGNCLVYENYGASPSVADPVHGTPLATGAQLTLTGPSGNKVVPVTSPGFYQAALAAAAPFFIAPGPFTITNGAGATVPSFTWDLTIPQPVVPNIPASFDRAKDLTLTWTGGSAFSVVTIAGFSAAPVESALSWVTLTCTADASAGSFTIPSALLSLFPTNGYGSPTAPDAVDFEIGGLAESHFTGADSPGLDEGFFTAFTMNGAVSKIQ